MKIVNMDAVFNRIEAEFIGLAHYLPGFDAAAGHPHREGVDVMIAAGLLAIFAHRRAAKFATPNDERVFEKPSCFQISDQRCGRLINVVANFFEIVFERFAGTSVAVPTCMIKLDETDTTFDEAAGEQAVARITRLVFFHAVKFESGFAFAGKVHQFGRAGLHFVRHLVGVNAGVDFRIAGDGETLEIQVANRVKRETLPLRSDSFGVAEIKNRITFGAQRDALIGGGKETAGPIRRPAAWSARATLENDERGEIARFAADSVSDPCAHARPSELAGPGVHEELGGRVIKNVRRTAHHKRDVIDNLAMVRHEFGNPHAALAALLETPARAKEFGFVFERTVHEGEAFSFDERIGNALAVQFDKLWFVIEKLELRRAAGHEEKDDVLRARGEMARLRRERIGGRRRASIEQRGEGEGAEADGAIAEEMPAGRGAQGIVGG